MINLESNTVDCDLVKIHILEHPRGQKEVAILLEANLNVPQSSEGIIIFVHGSGSGRLRQLRFDISLLSKRLIFAIDWIINNPDTKSLSIRLFGASTGAAAALVGAAERGAVSAIVSRGGRPELAGKDILRRVVHLLC
jgi:hypothetical protein